jgi:hypothetical protein
MQYSPSRETYQLREETNLLIYEKKGGTAQNVKENSSL